MSVPTRATWCVSVLTLYPDMFPGPLAHALSGRALKNDVWSCEAINIRDFAEDNHRSVDDTPAGGGAGMVLRPDILAKAIEAKTDDRPKLLMSPRGKPLTQNRVHDLVEGPGALIVCGRFEGVDQRVIDACELEEVSCGDYILSGGEIAAMALMDACIRLLPGVMGAEASAKDESFETGLLEYPHYTRPSIWRDRPIPDVLTGGNHKLINEWRKNQAEEITKRRRPDLWALFEKKAET